MNQPLARFRVYGWKSSLYFVVHVWATKRELLAQRRRDGLKPLRCDAFVFSYDQIHVRKGKPRRKRPIVGEIHFQHKKLGTEVITHESLHASVSLLQRLKFDFSALNIEGDPQNREELLAQVTGRMARSIVSGLYDRNLIN